MTIKLSSRHFSDISIIHKTYKFYLILYSYIKSFPKKDRYTLGQKSENLTLEILELLFLANSKQNQEKILILNNTDIKLKILKIVIRLSFDSKTINQKKYLLLEESLQEIGKMLGGWIKSIKEKYPAG